MWIIANVLSVIILASVLVFTLDLSQDVRAEENDYHNKTRAAHRFILKENLPEIVKASILAEIKEDTVSFSA